MSLYLKEKEINRPSHLGGNKWILKSLNEITIIFGRNGSGKSSLLRNLRDSDNNSYHYISPERAGDITHDVGIMQEEQTGDRRANRRRQNFSPTYRQEAVSRIQTLLLKIGNFTGRYDEKSPVNLNEIDEMVKILLPNFEFDTKDHEQAYKLTRLHSDSNVTSVKQLSSGESEVLALALDILTICSIWKIDKQKQRVLLMDEPDTHLHPDLQQHLADFLVKVLQKYEVQMIIATHSTTLLSALGNYSSQKTSVIYIDNSAEKQEAKKFDEATQELSTCLGGHALMGPLFNIPLLLVEGDDENRIWSQIPRHHKVKFAVIPCNGCDKVKQYQKTLEKLFSSIRSDNASPVGYALLDGDQSIPVDNNHPQQNIKYLKLSCRESENLFLTKEVLALIGTTWDKAKEKIKQESCKYPNEKSNLDGCDNWNRKYVDLKEIIDKIANIIDPKKVPWTKRIADYIGKNSDELGNEIADFLGEDVISSLLKNKRLSNT